MTSPITKNCHYISRFLTDPWQEQDRFLRYYDFDTDSFGRKSSKSLFAGQHINSPQTEQWLGEMIEGPLGETRPCLAKGEAGALKPWPRYRAAMLMLWLQGVRVHTLVNHDERRRLDALTSLPEREIDQLVYQMVQSYDLRLCPSEWRDDYVAPLLFPSTGVFQVVIPDPGCLSGHSIGIGLPICVEGALIATPKETHGSLDLSQLVRNLMTYTVGSSKAHRVVLAPGLYESLDEVELRRRIKAQRVVNDTLIGNVNKKRELVVEMFEISGIAVGRDAAGRIPPRGHLRLHG